MEFQRPDSRQFWPDEFLWRASIRPTAAIRSVTACKPNGIATTENSETKITAYGFYYDLDLFSDFTYFLTDPNKGDQFEQQDKRWVAGLDARHTLFNQWFGRDVENTFGLQVRNDWINNGLYQTENRVRVDKLDSAYRHHSPRRHGSGSILRTRKSVFMRKIKSSGRKNSAPSRRCAATWTTLMSPA